ncbi:hypothetical protein P3T73_16240 [Kiritimatiellota bacterium B12222]|nr:hypothetical protein P3T73_16240 [Kiritimatiellota bacterium B12222]
MKKIFFSLLFSFLFIGQTFAQSLEKVAHVDEAMGLKFPYELAGLRYRGLHSYREYGEGLGYSLRYEAEGPMKLDLYIYDHELNDLPEGVEADLVIMESKMTLASVKNAEKSGQYSNLKILTDQQIIEADNISFLKNQFSYNEVGSNVFTGKLTSESLLTSWGGSFIKVRYTFGGDDHILGQKVSQAIPTALAEILNQGGDPIRDEIHQNIFEAINIFRKDPHNKAAQVRIATYSMDSEAILINMTEKTAPWIAEEKDPSPASSILMLAFIAGNIDAQLIQGKAQDQSVAGARQVIQTYQLLRKENNLESIQEIETWIALDEHNALHTAFD